MSKTGAGLMIVRPWDFRILLVRRVKTKPYTWAFPGGKVESGETALQAAVRETREELGPVPDLGIFPQPFWYAERPEFSFAIFMAELKKPRDWEPVIESEHDAYGWYLPWELPRPTMPGARAAIKAFLL